jgi:hypothetical protein
MGEKILFPTHSCFDDALDLIDAWVTDDPAEYHRLILVHGICSMPGGEPYAHAWVEREDQCIFVGALNGQRQTMMVETVFFYLKFEVGETTRYTVAEAVAENARSNHYGPWKPEYIALCGMLPRDSYLLAKDLKTGMVGIFCKRCERISYNQGDVLNRYCGHCRRFLVAADSA